MIAKNLESSENCIFTCKQTGKPAMFRLVFRDVNGSGVLTWNTEYSSGNFGGLLFTSVHYELYIPQLGPCLRLGSCNSCFK